MEEIAASSNLPVHTYDWLVENYPEYCTVTYTTSTSYTTRRYELWFSAQSNIPNGLYVLPPHDEEYEKENDNVRLYIDKRDSVGGALQKKLEQTLTGTSALNGLSYILYQKSYKNANTGIYQIIENNRRIYEVITDKNEVVTSSYVTKPTSSDILTKTNIVEYAPTADYHPATKKYVDDSVSNLVNSAPETLDTLNELAAALGNDANFATTVATQIGQKQDKLTADTDYLTPGTAESTYQPKGDYLTEITYEVVTDSEFAAIFGEV